MSQRRFDVRDRRRRWCVLVCFTMAVAMLRPGHTHSEHAEEPVVEPADPSVTIVPTSGSHREPGKRTPTGKVSDRFANIALRTQHGQAVRFYDDLVKDKVVIVNLVYTRCTDICPGTQANLVQVHRLLGDRVGRDILLLSLSIDPEVDTPEVLKQYWEAFGSKPGWLYLTGDYDEIDQLRRELGIYDLDPVIDADKTQHSGVITFGNDRTDRWAALPALMDPKGIVKTVLRFTWDDKWARRIGTVNTGRTKAAH